MRQILRAGRQSRRTDNRTHACGQKLAHLRQKALTLCLIFNPAANGHTAIVRQQHQKTPRKTWVHGQSGAFIARGFFNHLHHNFLPWPQNFINAHFRLQKLTLSVQTRRQRITQV